MVSSHSLELGRDGSIPTRRPLAADGEAPQPAERPPRPAPSRQVGKAAHEVQPEHGEEALRALRRSRAPSPPSSLTLPKAGWLAS